MNSSAEDPTSQELDPSIMPSHVAIIMDGNGRWAKKRLFNRTMGHEKGVDTVRTITRASRRLGISVLTLYAFSTENWQRSKLEIAALMTILKKFLKTELKEMMDNNIRLTTIGQTSRLPDDARHQLEETMQVTEQNDGMLLNLALSYGSRTEITDMTRQIAEKVKTGDMDSATITEETVSNHLYTKGMPDPDLLIRTSGEMRISNFLLWQIAYAEIYITNTLWPDFTEEEYISILKEFQNRDRRYGKVKKE